MICLRFRAQDQTKSEEWKEFYFFQYQRLEWMENQIEEAQKQNASAIKSADSNKAEKLSFEMRVAAAKRDWESWSTWLQWVEGQLPTIAGNIASNEKALNNSHQVYPDPAGLTPNVEPSGPRPSLRRGSRFPRKSSISKHSVCQRSPHTASYRDLPVERSKCLENSVGHIPELSPSHRRSLRHMTQPSCAIVTREPPGAPRRSRRQIEPRGKFNAEGSSTVPRRRHQDDSRPDSSSFVLRRSIRIAQKKKAQSRCI